MGRGLYEKQQLVRSDKGKTGYKGVSLVEGRYLAKCTTAPCRHTHLGTFATPEDAAVSRTCSTMKRSTRRSWRRCNITFSSGRTEHHLQCCVKCNIICSSGRTRARQGTRGCLRTMAGTRLDVKQHLQQELPRQLRHPGGCSPGVPAALGEGASEGAGPGASTSAATSSAA